MRQQRIQKGCQARAEGAGGRACVPRGEAAGRRGLHTPLAHLVAPVTTNVLPRTASAPRFAPSTPLGAPLPTYAVAGAPGAAGAIPATHARCSATSAATRSHVRARWHAPARIGHGGNGEGGGTGGYWRA